MFSQLQLLLLHLSRCDLSEALTHLLPEMRCVAPCSIQLIREESPAVFKRIIVLQGESGVKVHRSSRRKQDKWAERDSGSSSAGKRGWQYILIDITTPLDRLCRFLEGWRSGYPPTGRGWRCGAMLRCSAASRTVHSGWARGGWGRCSFHSSNGPPRSPRPSGAPAQAWDPALDLTKPDRSIVGKTAFIHVTKCRT